MSEARPFDEMVERILEGQAPRQVRLAAARGALPLPRAALVQLHIHLRGDDDEEIRTTADANLQALERASVEEVLEDPSCAPAVLEFFAPRAVRDAAMAERIAFHQAVPASALALLAGTGSAEVIELVLTNQQRLLAQPELLDRLTVNPALRADQRGRILELLDRTSRARAKAVDGASAGPEETDADAMDAEELARLLDVDVGELFAASEIIDGEEFEMAEDPGVRTAYHRIMTLNTAQKAILAMRGGREERLILIRDTNKIVALSVLRNGRMRDDEIEHIARMRNVSDEVLREIGRNREWTKSYSIITVMLHNPRTPPGVSSNFIPRLRNPDLKRLMSNHDVPELIRRLAKRTLETRTQRHDKLRRK